MLNPAHVLETALLLLVAFLIGAVVGSLARMLVLRLGAAKSAAVAGAAAAAVKAPEQPSLVATPVIAPAAKPAPPAAPAEVPTPDFSEVAAALGAAVEAASAADAPRLEVVAKTEDEAAATAPVMAPAREAGKATSGRHVEAPRPASKLASVEVAATGTGAEVIPFPVERAAATSDVAAAPDAVPAVAEAGMTPVFVEGDTAGAGIAVPEATATAQEKEPVTLEAASPDALSTPEPALTVAADATKEESEEQTELVVVAADGPAAPLMVEAEAEETDQAESDAAAEEAAVLEPEVVRAEPVASDETEEGNAVAVRSAEIAPEPDDTEAAVAAAVDATAQAEAGHEDENAAMRAIEGGTWTPRSSTVRRTTPVPAPEGVAVEEERGAVAPTETQGKPVGLPGPRGGVKDSLTNIIGILPVIETSLNSLGVFHFDQVGQLSDENVAWIEAHLGIDGRIGREHWREQARELAASSDAGRKAAGT